MVLVLEDQDGEEKMKFQIEMKISTNNEDDHSYVSRAEDSDNETRGIAPIIYSVSYFRTPHCYILYFISEPPPIVIFSILFQEPLFLEKIVIFCIIFSDSLFLEKFVIFCILIQDPLFLKKFVIFCVIIHDPLFMEMFVIVCIMIQDPLFLEKFVTFCIIFQDPLFLEKFVIKDLPPVEENEDGALEFQVYSSHHVSRRHLVGVTSVQLVDVDSLTSGQVELLVTPQTVYRVSIPTSLVIASVFVYR